MAITTFDPKTALIVIDLQKGIVGMATVHSGAEVVKRAAALAEAFRRHGRRRTSQPFPPTGRNSSRN